MTVGGRSCAASSFAGRRARLPLLGSASSRLKALTPKSGGVHVVSRDRRPVRVASGSFPSRRSARRHGRRFFVEPVTGEQMSSSRHTSWAGAPLIGGQSPDDRYALRRNAAACASANSRKLSDVEMNT